ncbi:hypothetical protein SAMN05421665_1558 [Yoonia rosea]|uniref:Uncharacterized protein n=1 Tax=Yoonia rosea TaxID=287098 RepID=A0A1R3WYN8_9RHOB|nr:hypothetical protein [Yoonia rosea]SIT82885.1 hypothetical protein SAMN05421665_1558 [Yoonia rosea]
MRHLWLLPFLLIPACATFPALDGTVNDAARQAPYPTLTQLPSLPPVSGSENADLQARIAALQARAAQLRQIDIAALQ